MDHRLSSVLSRFSPVDLSSDVGPYVGAALAELAVQHLVPRERIYSLWDQIVGTLLADEVGVDSGIDASAAGAWFAEQNHSLAKSLQVVLGLRGIAIEALHRGVRMDGRVAADAIAGMDLVSWSMNEFMVSFNAGYFAVDFANRTRQQSQHNAFVRKVLAGAATEDDGFIRFGAFGLETGVPYRAFRSHPATGQELAALEAYLDLNRADGVRLGLSTVIDGDVCGFVANLPDEPAPILIAVSPPVPVAELPNAFRRATRAFHVASRGRLSGIQSMESLGILVSVISDGDVAAILDETYLEPLRQMGSQGETLLLTLRSYVGNDFQLAATARDLGLHVNTVRYRLSRFEEKFGITLRDTKLTAELWWMLHMRGA